MYTKQSVFLLIVIIVVLFSCTSGPNLNVMYPGDERLKSEIACVNCPENIVLYIDNKKALESANNLILPGNHTLHFYYEDETLDTNTKRYNKIRSKDYIIGFTAEADKEYRIMHDWVKQDDKRLLTTRLEEKQTNGNWLKISDGYIIEMEVDVHQE
ncbi:DUF2057 family protein [Candidatus Neomarinimicrobiota bacterium]